MWRVKRLCWPQKRSLSTHARHQLLFQYAASAAPGSQFSKQDADRVHVLQTNARYARQQTQWIRGADQETRSTYHFVINQPLDETLLQFLAKELDLSQEKAHHILELGAVYMGHSVANRHHQFILDDYGRVGTDSAHTALTKGSYIRVCTSPFYYKKALDVRWDCRIKSITHDWVIVEKPSGVPSVPTVYNAIHNAMTQTALTLGTPTLHPVMRLDVCTSGLLLFARHPIAARQLSQHTAITKQYTALTQKAIPCGELTHWCRNTKRMSPQRPRIYARYDADWQPAANVAMATRENPAKWKRAISRVLKCDAATDTLFQMQMELVTGRTHQLRLQLAAQGAAIVGDSRYAPVNGKQHSGSDDDDRVDWFGPEPDSIALHASQLSFTWGNDNALYTVDADPPDWRRLWQST